VSDARVDKEERERNRVLGMGYVYGRIDAGDTRVDDDQATDFGAYFVRSGAWWPDIAKTFEKYVAEQVPVVTS